MRPAARTVGGRWWCRPVAGSASTRGAQLAGGVLGDRGSAHLLVAYALLHNDRRDCSSASSRLEGGNDHLLVSDSGDLLSSRRAVADCPSGSSTSAERVQREAQLGLERTTKTPSGKMVKSMIANVMRLTPRSRRSRRRALKRASAALRRFISGVFGDKDRAASAAPAWAAQQEQRG